MVIPGLRGKSGTSSPLSRPQLKEDSTATASWATIKADITTASDFILQKASGETSSGGEEILGSNGVQAVYAPFTSQLHEPSFFKCTETKDGWTMVGQAHVYVNLHGEPVAEEKKANDASEKGWDAGTPAAFRFDHAKDDTAKEGGIKLKRTNTFADSAPAMTAMIMRGLIQAKDLGFWNVESKSFEILLRTGK